MPELPEVETIIRSISNAVLPSMSILNQEVMRVDVFWNRTLANQTPSSFAQRMCGQRILSIFRRGKFLVFQLTKDVMLIHLRMSGDVRVERSFDANGVPQKPHKHDRLIITFANHTRLIFYNPRKFGRVWLMDDPDSVLASLGPEPLDPNLSPQLFFKKLQAHKRQIKPLLMDQHFLAGLGNIYTDEALFHARIHPLRISNAIKREESKALLDAIRLVLKEGIRRNGASIDWVYRGGEFQNQFQVYGRAGDPCPRCGAKIERIVVSQRGTHICVNCQK